MYIINDNSSESSCSLHRKFYESTLLKLIFNRQFFYFLLASL